jgi:hypothetical protein
VEAVLNVTEVALEVCHGAERQFAAAAWPKLKLHWISRGLESASTDLA